MINDPNYNLPKDVVIRLFDNPIPAGDPARSEAPEWAQELDEVVVWAHMGDNGQVSVKVNGEDIGGGGLSFAPVLFTPATTSGPDLNTYVPGPSDNATIICDLLTCASSSSYDPMEYYVAVPSSVSIPTGVTIAASSTGSFTFDTELSMLTITGDANIVFEVI